MAGELENLDNIPEWQADRLAAWHLLYHPQQARDWVIAQLRDQHNIPPERGAPIADQALWRAQRWSRVQVEALADAAGGWEESPIPLSAVPNLPAFPADIFPAWLAEEVLALAEFAQVPVDLPGMIALAVLSAGMGGRARVETHPGHQEPVNIYSTAALPPGSRKSSVHAVLITPLLAAEKELASEARSAISEARTARAIADKAARDAEKLAADAAADQQKSAEEKELARQDAIAKAALAGAIAVPVVPRIVADDVTPEEAASLLADQGGRLAVLSAEGGPFVSLTGRYSREPNMEVFLKGWSGDMLRVDRKSRPPDFVDNPALTLGLAIQPEVLKQIYSMPGFSGRGLLARVLYSLPRNTVGYRRVRTSPVPSGVSARYTETVKSLVRDYASWVPEPALFRLDPAAAEMLMQAAEQLEPCLRPDGRLGHITSWAAKLTGTTARIAGLLHGAAHLDGAYRYPVSGDTMNRAIRLGDYLTDHALAVFDFMGADPATDDAHAVFEWLRGKGRPQFTQRDLHRAMQTRFRKAEDTEPALAVLAGNGWIKEAKAPSPGRQGGRPPSPVFLVHPALLRKGHPFRQN